VFDVESVRQDFPILEQEVNGHPLVYLDNAATTQKPRAVIDALTDYYSSYNSNVHRGAHSLSDRATQAFEDARTTVANALNSPSSKQVIWTRGTTESINLVAHSWAAANLKSGQRILVSYLEHHSNIVPWQLVAEKTGAELVAIPITEAGEVDLAAFESLLDERVAVVSIAHVSNALGSVNPVEKLVTLAKKVGAVTVVDGAQGIAHFPVDVQALGCDFYAFSGHKIFGPTGIGALWGREDLLDAMPPWHGGGEMIETVRFDGTTYASLPFKFEAGTPNIAGAIGLAAAFDYISQFDRKALADHEQDLLHYCIDRMSAIDGLSRLGSAQDSASVFSFLVAGTHPADIGSLLDQQGVAIRTGHHCTQPLMQHFSVPGTARASFSIYNTRDEIDVLFDATQKVLGFLR
jgi:cysteine desulfurase/selenocysteine lyase